MMSIAQPLARIQFDGYIVKKVAFRLSEVREEGPVDIDFQVEHTISLDEERTQALVVLQCSVFPKAKRRAPFRLSLEMEGHFTVRESQGDPKELDNMLARNTIAIMFPYLRAAVSSITAAANVAPLVLPTVNIVELIRNKGSRVVRPTSIEQG